MVLQRLSTLRGAIRLAVLLPFVAIAMVCEPAEARAGAQAEVTTEPDAEVTTEPSIDYAEYSVYVSLISLNEIRSLVLPRPSQRFFVTAPLEQTLATREGVLFFDAEQDY